MRTRLKNITLDKEKRSITNKNFRNVNIDCARILAAFMVLMVHIGQHTGLNEYTAIGDTGVQLFFIISGYLIFHSLESSKDTLVYYKKRAIRIIPIYYLFLIILYLYEILYYSYFHSMTLTEIFSGPCSYRYLRYFAFLQGILPSDDWTLWNNRSALWTLSSFFIFYLIAPFIYKFIKKYWQSFFLLVFFLFMTPIVKIWLYNLLSSYPDSAGIEYFVNATPINNLYCFLLGVTLYYATKNNKEGLYGLIITCTLIFTQFQWHQYELVFTLLLLILVNLHPLSKNNRTAKIIHFISSGSFALYLCHPPILQISNIICIKLGFGNGIKLVLLLASTIFCSYTFYYLISRPLENKFEQMWLGRSKG